jgi:N-methylhydantoinase B
MATRLRFEVFEPEGIVTARGMERLRFQPWGVAGGRCGTSGGATLNPGTPYAREIGKIDVLRLEPGDVVEVRSAGGAGYGDPLARPIEGVLAHVRAGFVSEGAAREFYGIVVKDGELDAEAARRLRPALGARPRRALDLGDHRRAYETVWPEPLRAGLVERLMALPLPLRGTMKRRMHEAVAAADPPPRTVEALDSLWQRVRSAIGGA